jgi:hypothetical protein
MAKIISIWKRSSFKEDIGIKLQHICQAIAPDNIHPSPALVKLKESWAYGIMNPVSSINTTANGVLLGALYEDAKEWDKIGANQLDGSFAIFRDDEHIAQICSDMGGSRSIWYYNDNEYFIASTSQRAIVMFLGSFELDQRVIPWMLSTGTLGPYFSWDQRIKLLPSDSVLTFNKKEWEFEVDHKPVVYQELEKSDSKHEEDLLQAVDETFKNIKVDLQKWAITLSGGKDSRGILLLLLKKTKNSRTLKTYTYGHKGYDEVKDSDGYIAKRLAKKYGIKNEYFSAFSISENEPVSKICDRILKTGEGRVDNIAGYMDGLAFWKYLHENGTEGIIRGDINFGLAHNLTFKSVKESHFFGQVYLSEEWENLKFIKTFDLPKQEFPEEFHKKPEESYNDFQDRFYSSYRMPFLLAALSDFKLSYLEVINPLLSRKILTAIRSTPDHLRRGAKLWNKYLKTMEKDIPYAINASHDIHLNEMGKSSFRQHQLNCIRNSTYLPDYLKQMVIKGEKANLGLKGKLIQWFRKSKIKNLLTTKQRFLIWRNFIGKRKDPILSKEKMINRIFIISEMQRILQEDSELLKKEEFQNVLNIKSY